jgi:hypothetical protein
MKFVGENGEVEQAAVDGYSFGDTQLEGVMFICEIQDDSVVCVGVEKDAEQYMKTLNRAHWIEQATVFARQNDIFYEVHPLTGKVDGSKEVWVEGMDQALVPGTEAQMIRKISGDELLAKLKGEANDLGVPVDGGNGKLPLIICGCGEEVEVKQALPMVSHCEGAVVGFQGTCECGKTYQLAMHVNANTPA